MEFLAWWSTTNASEKSMPSGSCSGPEVSRTSSRSLGGDASSSSGWMPTASVSSLDILSSPPGVQMTTPGYACWTANALASASGSAFPWTRATVLPPLASSCAMLDSTVMSKNRWDIK